MRVAPGVSAQFIPSAEFTIWIPGVVAYGSRFTTRPKSCWNVVLRLTVHEADPRIRPLAWHVTSLSQAAPCPASHHFSQVPGTPPFNTGDRATPSAQVKTGGLEPGTT